MVIYFQIIMNYFSFYPGPSATRSFQAIVFKFREQNFAIFDYLFEPLEDEKAMERRSQRDVF